MKRHLAAILALLLCATFAMTQNAPVPPPDTKPKPRAATAPATGAKDKDEDEDRLKVENADVITYDGVKTYHLTGKVVFANRNMKIYCDEADYNEDTDTAKAKGNLRIVDENTVVTGKLLDADFGKDLAIVTGDVVIVTQKKGNKVEEKPAPALEKPTGPAATLASNQPVTAPEKTAEGKPAKSGEPERLEDYWQKKSTIICERLEYFYADEVKKMIATPRVKAVQEDKTVLADHAVYEDLAGLITLTGNVVLTKTNGEEMKCKKAVVSTEDDTIQAEGMSGIIPRKKKTDDKPPEPAAEPAEAAPAPSPPSEGGAASGG